MSGKKGMKKYPMGIREEVVSRIRAGESQRALSREYEISRYFQRHEDANLQKHWPNTSMRTNG